MKKIIVFGRGSYLSKEYDNLRNKYEIECILDNSVTDEAMDDVYQVPVYNPKRIEELPKIDIICMALKFVDMWKQLVELSVSVDRIKFGEYLLRSQLPGELFDNNEKLYATENNIVLESEKYGQYLIKTQKDYEEACVNLWWKKHEGVKSIQNLPLKPASRRYGGEHGKPVDRYYIEQFLDENKDAIQGDVLEIASPAYTRQFGKDKVKKEVVLHVKGWGNGSVKGNLETGEGIKENWVDCMICTQTLQFIYDLESAIGNIYKLLKPKGTALITVPGIKSLSLWDDETWGEKWSFTPKSMQTLCEKFFDKKNINVQTFGNVKVATAFLYGLSMEDLTTGDFEYCDEQFPFIIAVRVSK